MKNKKSIEPKEKSFERVPPKRHSSYEDRVSNDSHAHRINPRLYVTQRNNTSSVMNGNKKKLYQNNEYSINNAKKDFIAVRGKSSSSVQDYIKRATSNVM